MVWENSSVVVVAVVAAAVAVALFKILVGNLLQDGTGHVQIDASRCIHVQIDNYLIICPNVVKYVPKCSKMFGNQDFAKNRLFLGMCKKCF